MNLHLTPGLRALVITTVMGLGLVAVANHAEAHPRARVNVWFGGPFWWGIPFGYGFPYLVERPVVVQPIEGPVFAPSAAQQMHYWYYCREAQMYYPYVSACPSAWQEVPATPAAPEPVTPETPASPTTRAPGTPVPPARAN